MTLKDKAEDLASEHAEQIEEGIDKVADLVEDKVGTEHADKVDGAADKAKDFVANLKDD
jgi:hypothetical protein